MQARPISFLSIESFANNNFDHYFNDNNDDNDNDNGDADIFGTSDNHTTFAFVNDDDSNNVRDKFNSNINNYLNSYINACHNKNFHCRNNCNQLEFYDYNKQYNDELWSK